MITVVYFELSSRHGRCNGVCINGGSIVTAATYDLPLSARSSRLRSPDGSPDLDIAALLPAGDWTRLPASLRRRFRVGHGPASYVGIMDFELSRVGSWFARLARPFGAPLPSAAMAALPVVVHVHPARGGVVWARQLGTQWIRSIKQAGAGGTIVETTQGGLGMVLDLSVERRALVFTSRSFFLALGRWRVPIPALLTPGRCRVEHRAIDDSRFCFTLTMTHPVWGLTSRQTGVFTEQPERQP